MKRILRNDFTKFNKMTSTHPHFSAWILFLTSVFSSCQQSIKRLPRWTLLYSQLHNSSFPLCFCVFPFIRSLHSFRTRMQSFWHSGANAMPSVYCDKMMTNWFRTKQLFSDRSVKHCLCLTNMYPTQNTWDWMRVVCKFPYWLTQATNTLHTLLLTG